MCKYLSLALVATFLISFKAPAAETFTSGANVRTDVHRYSSNGRTWAEGTVSKVGKDGTIIIRGARNPYANHYFSYNRDYYANPERRTELGTQYRDRMGYTWSDNNASDFTFVTPNYDSIVIYDEPNYGAEFDKWTYNENPRTYRFVDLQEGDRIVVAYDANGNKVERLYRVHPSMTTHHSTIREEVREVTPDNTRANNVSEKDNTRSLDNQPAIRRTEIEPAK